MQQSVFLPFTTPSRRLEEEGLCTYYTLQQDASLGLSAYLKCARHERNTLGSELIASSSESENLIAKRQLRTSNRNNFPNRRMGKNEEKRNNNEKREKRGREIKRETSELLHVVININKQISHRDS